MELSGKVDRLQIERHQLRSRSPARKRIQILSRMGDSSSLSDWGVTRLENPGSWHPQARGAKVQGA